MLPFSITPIPETHTHMPCVWHCISRENRPVIQCNVPHSRCFCMLIRRWFLKCKLDLQHSWVNASQLLLKLTELGKVHRTPVTGLLLSDSPASFPSLLLLHSPSVYSLPSPPASSLFYCRYSWHCRSFISQQWSSFTPTVPAWIHPIHPACLKLNIACSDKSFWTHQTGIHHPFQIFSEILGVSLHST